MEIAKDCILFLAGNWSQDLVVRGPRHKSTRLIHGQLSLWSFGNWLNEYQEFLRTYRLNVTCLVTVALQSLRRETQSIKRDHEIYLSFNYCKILQAWYWIKPILGVVYNSYHRKCFRPSQVRFQFPYFQILDIIK